MRYYIAAVFLAAIGIGTVSFGRNIPVVPVLGGILVGMAIRFAFTAGKRYAREMGPS